MTLTNVLLAMIFCGVLVDIWITRRWLAESHRIFDEIKKQALGTLKELGIADDEERR